MASECLHSASVDDKLNTTRCALARLKGGQIDYASGDDPLPISATVFPDSPQLVEPRKLPRRSLSTDKGRVALLHSLAHIEFYAVHLAWDIIYRFRGLPIEFYQDWLRVAGEEALHFGLLRNRLNHLGSEYGSLAAHRGLWDVAADTADDVLARLALVPRTLEARGLDVTPAMIDKLLNVGDHASAEILRRILEDEIGHVAVGSFWFKAVCKERGVDSATTYIEMIQQFLNGKIRGPLNYELRKQAGFDDWELRTLDAMK